MIRYKIYITFCIILFSMTQLQAQNSGNSALRAVYNKLQRAKDYSVKANIKLDMPFIRMLPVNVKIYFKQKDRIKVVSKSIAIVPRQGFGQISKILADTASFISLVQGTEKIGNLTTSVVNVIPVSDTSDIILGKLWIDAIHHVVVKSQLTSKTNGTIGTEYSYGSQVDYGLPDKMIFSVDVKKFKIPKKLVNNGSNTSPEQEEKSGGSKKGTIYIVLSDYQINKGIPDSMFKK